MASGSLTVGSTLSCTTGTWTNSPTGYAYTWLRGGTAISGATSATYVTVTADGGTSVGCSVIAANASGNSGPSASNTLAIAAAGGCAAATNYLARTMSGTEGGNATNITTLIAASSPTVCHGPPRQVLERAVCIQAQQNQPMRSSTYRDKL